MNNIMVRTALSAEISLTARIVPHAQTISPNLSRLAKDPGLRPEPRLYRFCERVIAASAILAVSDPGSSYAQIAAYNGGSTYAHCTASDVEGNPVGEGPWIGASQSGTDVKVTWGGDGWNKWHFRWGQDGEAEKAYEYGGDQKSFTIDKVGFCQHFTLKISGCVTHVIGKDRCSSFEQSNFTSAPERPSGPDTCAKGYVWRESYPNDHVCVLPEVRSQAAADNERRQLAPCPSPLVPRLAHTGDNICVSVAVANEVRSDNQAICSRLVRCP